MKRLFILRRADNHNPVRLAGRGATPIRYFDDKMEAKEARDSMEAAHYISRGPDHIGPHGSRGVPHKHAEGRKGVRS